MTMSTSQAKSYSKRLEPKFYSRSMNPERRGIKFVLGIMRQAGRRVSEVQSVLFEKARWTLEGARSWLRDHGFRFGDLEETDEYYRFRQAPPGQYGEFRTIPAGARNLHGPERTNPTLSSKHQEYLEGFEHGYRDGAAPKEEANLYGKSIHYEAGYRNGYWAGLNVADVLGKRRKRLISNPTFIQHRRKLRMRADWVREYPDYREGYHRGFAVGEDVESPLDPGEQRSVKYRQGYADGLSDGTYIHHAQQALRQMIGTKTRQFGNPARHPDDPIYMRGYRQGYMDGADEKPHRVRGVEPRYREGYSDGYRDGSRAYAGQPNPEEIEISDSAVELYEDFHGRPPDKIEEHVEQIEVQRDLAQLGTLTELKVATISGLDATIAFDPDDPQKRVQLASSPDGKQLFFVGGDQSVDLEAVGMSGAKWVRDSMVLGVLYELTYRTEKGFDSFRLTDYYHELGEETGVQPLLIYDPLNERLSVSGGQYQIRREGIVN
jgi:hypothetical protein